MFRVVSTCHGAVARTEGTHKPARHTCSRETTNEAGSVNCSLPLASFINMTVQARNLSKNAYGIYPSVSLEKDFRLIGGVKYEK